MSRRNPGEQYGKALDQLRAAESKLSRAFKRWERAKRTLARLERRLDKAQAQLS